MSTVPAAIDGLLGLLRITPALSGVRIDDGPWVTRPDEPDVVVIGWLPDEGATVDWVADIAGLDSEAESYEIQGLVSSWNGESVIKTARDRADALLEAVRAAIRAGPTLGGAVSRARLAALHLTQYQTSQGCEVTIDFTVRADVF